MSFLYIDPPRNMKASVFKDAYHKILNGDDVQNDELDEFMISSILINPKEATMILSRDMDGDHNDIVKMLSKHKIIHRENGKNNVGFFLYPLSRVVDMLKSTKNIVSFSESLAQLGIFNEENNGETASNVANLKFDYNAFFKDFMGVAELIKKDLKNVGEYIENRNKYAEKKVVSLADFLNMAKKASKANEGEIIKYLQKLKKLDFSLAKIARIFFLSARMLTGASKAEKFILASYGFFDDEVGMSHENYLRELISYFPDYAMDFLTMTRISLQRYALKRIGMWYENHAKENYNLFSFFAVVDEDFVVTLPFLTKHPQPGEYVQIMLDGVYDSLPHDNSNALSGFRIIEAHLIKLGFVDTRSKKSLAEKISESEKLKIKGKELAELFLEELKQDKPDRYERNFIDGDKIIMHTNLHYQLSFNMFLFKHTPCKVVIVDPHYSESKAKECVEGKLNFHPVNYLNIYAIYMLCSSQNVVNLWYQTFSETISEGQAKEVLNFLKDAGFNFESENTMEMVTIQRLKNTQKHKQDGYLSIKINEKDLRIVEPPPASGVLSWVNPWSYFVDQNNKTQYFFTLSPNEAKIYAIERYPDLLLDIIKKDESKLISFLVENIDKKRKVFAANNFAQILINERKKLKEIGATEELELVEREMRKLGLAFETNDEDVKQLITKVRNSLDENFKGNYKASAYEMLIYLYHFCPESFVNAFNENEDSVSGNEEMQNIRKETKMCLENSAKTDMYVKQNSQKIYNTISRAVSLLRVDSNKYGRVASFIKNSKLPFPPKKGSEDDKILSIILGAEKNLDFVRHVVLKMAPNRLLEILECNAETLISEALAAYGENESRPIRDLITMKDHEREFENVIMQKKLTLSRKIEIYSELMRLQLISSLPSDLEKRKTEVNEKISKHYSLRTNAEVLKDVEIANSVGSNATMQRKPSARVTTLKPNIDFLYNESERKRPSVNARNEKVIKTQPKREIYEQNNEIMAPVPETQVRTARGKNTMARGGRGRGGRGRGANPKIQTIRNKSPTRGAGYEVYYR